MPVFLSEFVGQLKEIWKQLSGSQRLTVAAVVAATLVGLSALVWIGTRPDYIPFGNQFTGSDRVAVVSAFEEASIDFRLAGNLLEINAAQQSEAQAALVKRGLTSGDSSSDPGDGLLPDKETRRFQLQRRRTRSIEATLRKLRGVRAASVLMNEPPAALFVRDRRRKTATVMLSLVDSAKFRITAERALSIVTKGLGIAREDVEITSSDLQALSSASSGAGGRYATHLILQARASQILTAKAKAYLDTVWPGKTHVAVNVEYDNKVINRHKKLISETKVLKGETSYKSSDSQPKGTGGDPNGTGTSSGASAATGGSAASSSTSTVKHTDKQYEPIVGEETVEALAPDLLRISVSLSVDRSLDANKAEIVELVKGAVGWQEKRDRQFTASVVEFPDIEEMEQGGGVLDMVKRYLPIGGQVISVLLVLLFLRGLLKRSKAETRAASTAASRESKDEDPARASRSMRRQIEKAVEQDPASVSRLLEAWLSDKSEVS